MDGANFTQEIMNVIVPAALSVISILATWGIYELRKFVAQRTRSQELDEAITIIGEIVQDTVRAVDQKAKTEMKENRQLNGKILKATAYASIKSQIPPKIRQMVERNVGNFEEFVSNKIESEVYWNNNRS